MKFVVDGETFEVSEREPGVFDYTWTSGPNTGYGFTSRLGYAETEEPAEPVGDIHTPAIREFLSAVDPTTGYIEEASG